MPGAEADTVKLAEKYGLLGQLGWPLVKPAAVAGIRLSLKRFADFARHHTGRA